MKIQVVALVCLSSALFGVSEGWAAMGKPQERLKNTPVKSQCDTARAAYDTAKNDLSQCDNKKIQEDNSAPPQVQNICTKGENGYDSCEAKLVAFTVIQAPNCASQKAAMNDAAAKKKKACNSPIR